jgi:predicted dehydrogenase
MSAPDEEPLRRQLAAFVECARSRSEPAVSGADGLRALRLAHTILARIAEQG